MWFALFKFFITVLVQAAIGALLRPKPERQDANVSLEDLDFPTAERGRKIPLVVGRRHIKSPNVIWYKAGEIFQSGQQDAYTHYSAAMHMVIAYSPLLLFEVITDNKAFGVTSLSSREASSKVYATLTGFGDPKTVYYDEFSLTTFEFQGIGQVTGAIHRFSFGGTRGGTVSSGASLLLSIQDNVDDDIPITIRGTPSSAGYCDDGGCYVFPANYSMFIYRDETSGSFVAGVAAEIYNVISNGDDEQGYYATYVKAPSLIQTVSVSDELYNINELNEQVDGVIYDNTTIRVNLPNLFGGEKKSGGIVGRIDYMNGLDAPLPTTIEYLEDKQGGVSPHYYGVSSLLVRGDYGNDYATLGANSPVVKPWAFDVGGYYNSLGIPDFMTIINEGANAACFLYDCLINKEWGKGLDPSQISVSSFQEVAEILYNENLGCSFVWTDTDKIDTIMSKVLDDIFGYWNTDLFDEGKISIGLLRAYSGLIADLPRVNPLKIKKNKGRSANQGVNQLILKYKSHGVYEDIEQSINLTNDAALAVAGGQVRAKTINLPTISDEASATYIGNLHLMVESYPLSTYQITVDQFDLEVVPGDFVYFLHDNSNTPIHRVINMDTKDRQTTLTLMEDMFSYSLSDKLASFYDLSINTKVDNLEPTHPVTLPYQALNVFNSQSSMSNSHTVRGLGIYNNYNPTTVKSWTISSSSNQSLMTSNMFSGGFLSAFSGLRRGPTAFLHLDTALSSHNETETWTQTNLPTVYAGAITSEATDIPTLASLPYLGYMTTGEWVLVTTYDTDSDSLTVRRGAMGSTPRPAPIGTTLFLTPFDSSANNSMGVRASYQGGSLLRPGWEYGSTVLNEKHTYQLAEDKEHSKLHTYDFTLDEHTNTAVPPAFIAIADDPITPTAYKKLTNHGQVHFDWQAETIRLKVGTRIPTATNAQIYATDTEGLTFPSTSTVPDTPYYDSVKLYYTITENDNPQVHEVEDTQQSFSLHDNLEISFNINGIDGITMLDGVLKFTVKVYCDGYRGGTKVFRSEPYVLHFFAAQLYDPDFRFNHYTWYNFVLPSHEEFNTLLVV